MLTLIPTLTFLPLAFLALTLAVLHLFTLLAPTLPVPQGHTATVSSVCVSAARLFTASHDGTLRQAPHAWHAPGAWGRAGTVGLPRVLPLGAAHHACKLGLLRDGQPPCWG